MNVQGFARISFVRPKEKTITLVSQDDRHNFWINYKNKICIFQPLFTSFQNDGPPDFCAMPILNHIDVTGLIVLAAAVITSRYQRIQESVLLRTLGATRKQVMRIMVIEYIFLGGFAALTGLFLSYLGGWALAYFVFEAVFLPTLLPFIIVLLMVIALTVLIGMLNSRGILDLPPLEVLRVEG